MAEREILMLGNPVLWQKSLPVSEFHSDELRALVSDLDDTLAAFRRRQGFGRGIAAPQVGILKRVIFIRMLPSGFSDAMINPQILWQSGQTAEIWDSCFSFPELEVKIVRATDIRVQYQNPEDELKTIEATADLSELLQHEIDHLDGILATDRAISPRAFRIRSRLELPKSS